MQQNFFIQRERQVRGTILQECGGAVWVPPLTCSALSLSEFAGRGDRSAFWGGRFGSSGRNSRFRKLGNAGLGIDTS
jgi:hypothetical protein